MNKARITTGLFVVIIIILFYNFSYQSSILHKLLTGFWQADKQFCDEANLDLFCIYFDEDLNFLKSRGCYILAKQSDDIVINQPTKCQISLDMFNFANWRDIKTVKTFTIRFDEIEEEVEKVFPKIQKLDYDPVLEKIVLYYGETISAVLYKNPHV